MNTPVPLPALGEAIDNATISQWLKAVGDSVAAGEPLVEVSTDKVDTEIESPASGVLIEIRIGEDEVVDVGAILAVIGDGADEPAPDAPVAAGSTRDGGWPTPAIARFRTQPAAQSSTPTSSPTCWVATTLPSSSPGSRSERVRYWP